MNSLPIFEYPYYKIKRVIAEALLKRDGDRCVRCGRTNCSLLIQEFSGHRPWSSYLPPYANLCLYCKACNSQVKGNYIKISAQTGVGVKEAPNANVIGGLRLAGLPLDLFPNPTILAHQVLAYKSGGFEAKSNDYFEPAFIEWLLNEIHIKYSVFKRNAINGGAAAVGCSPATSARYLAKLIDPLGGGPLEEGYDQIETIQNGRTMIQRGEPIVMAKRVVWQFWREAKMAKDVSEEAQAKSST